jgi:hypothetical protein
MKLAYRLGVLTALALPLASSADYVVGRIPQVHGMSMPATVSFELSRVAESPPTSCVWFNYNASHPDTAKAVFAVVLAAQVSGKKVYVDYNPAGCLVNYVSITNW